MSRHFVLDENVVILAQKEEDEYGNPSTLCLSLILNILTNNHSLALTAEGWGIYCRQIQTLQNQGFKMTPKVIAIIKAIVFNSNNNMRFLDDHSLPPIPELESLTGVDVTDRVFVRTAAAVGGCHLVTTDTPLVIAIQESGISSKYSFGIVKPPLGLQLSQEQGHD